MAEILLFLKTNQEAFTVAGILLTFLISLISLKFTVKNNKAVHYVNSVTKSRVEWVDKLREDIANFIAILDTQDLTDTIAKTDDIVNYPFNKNLQKLNQIGSEIKLMLNFSDSFDRDIMEQIDIITYHYKILYVIAQRCILENQKNELYLFEPNKDMLKKQNEINKSSEKLLSDMQIYLKSEWNRIKHESKGETYEKETQLFDLKELIEKKSNPDYKNNHWKRACINTKAKYKRILKSSQFSIIVFVIGIIIFLLNISDIVKSILTLV